MTAPNYEGYEDLSSFSGPQLARYRQALLEKTKPQIDFVLKHISLPSYRIVEIGSGNGRFLIGMANRARNGKGLLAYGYGMDLSASRVAFAEQWAGDWFKQNWISGPLVFLQEDILTKISGPYVDIAVCITGCIQYFNPAEVKHVLGWMRSHATYGLFELYHRPVFHTPTQYGPLPAKTWHKLPDTDKFTYLLDEYTPDNPTKHTKIFIGRDGSVDERVEHLRYYGDIEFRRLLAEAGFTNLLWDVSDDTKRVVLVS